ncbi:MAG TPA: hypothetical protein VJY35_05755 [Candidatus Eisenbacteria bacterium]|nr:hypothetical protein [Candidatus Eisenbacteria bacterium]
MRTALKGCLAALMLLLPLTSGAGGSDMDDTIEPLRTWSLPASAGETLEIKLMTGAGVRIIGWDKDEISVASDWTDEKCRDAEFEVQRLSQGALVATRYPAGTGVVTHNCSFSIEIKLPRKFDVRIRSAGGGVAIQDMRGDVTGTTGGGSIEVSGLRGSIRLRTGGGSIMVRDSDLEGSLATGGGAVRFTNVSGGVTGWSGSQRGVVRGRSRSS